jgi:hypothetical protein
MKQKKFNKEKYIKALSRAVFGQLPKTKVVPMKTNKKPKYKLELIEEN